MMIEKRCHKIRDMRGGVRRKKVRVVLGMVDLRNMFS